MRDCLCVCGKGWQTASSTLVSGVWCPYPQAVASGTGNDVRGFCFVGHVASEKNFNFPPFHFRSGFRRRRRRRLVCVAHITHTQRARQGATGSRKCCLPLGALPNRALACSLTRCLCLCHPFCALLFDFVIRLDALNCHNSRVSLALSLCGSLRLPLALFCIFPKRK